MAKVKINNKTFEIPAGVRFGELHHDIEKAGVEFGCTHHTVRRCIQTLHLPFLSRGAVLQT